MLNWASYLPIGNERDYLLDAFDSGWVSGGEYVARFEQKAQDVFGVENAFAVSNGTTALQLAFQSLGLKSGDEVITPAFCFHAATNVLVQLGAIPTFSDIDPRTLNQTLETIQAATTDSTKGVVLVHNYGGAVEVKRIVEWAHSRGLWVVEDCAEAWFSRYEGRYCGTFGDVATFSMHAAKTVSSGEGGLVLTNRNDLIPMLTQIRSHGLVHPEKAYKNVLAGHNFRLSNLHAALAYAQLENYQTLLAGQNSRYECYTNNLNHEYFDLQESAAGAQNSFWAVALIIKNERPALFRDAMIEKLYKKGVECKPGFYPVSELSYLSEYQGDLHAAANEISSRILVPPCGAYLCEKEIKYICELLSDVYESCLTDEYS